ncbi:MAG: carboxypeptidase-like regulatory domain-containing protein, partial [Pedobacter sp.]|nr:carboxypeptidase-like regulatory domain-containing protein [Pedobacter sp.]
MRILLPSLFFILFFLPNAIAQKNGDVSGLISSSDAKGAANITVQLNGTSMVTVSDKNGAYHFDNVRYGKYLLRIKCIGIQTEEKSIVLNSKKLIVNFTLKEDHQQLLEVQVNSGLINKYANKESESVARLPLPNLENPQVYSVISKELLQEQGATDFKVAFKNVTGVIATAAPNGAFYIRTRGFYTGINLRNGLAVQQFTGMDLINVEKIEVLKGPSGTLFGSSLVSYGGLVNKVTKKPLDTFKGAVNYSIGSWNLNRLTADIN